MPDHPATTDAGETLAWRIEGMDCASCVAKVRTAVERLPGTSEVEVNLMAERLTLTGAAGWAGPDAVERQVSSLGYRATPMRGQNATKHGHDGAGGHGGHLHAHSEAEEAEARAGVPWWRTGKARLAAGLALLVGVAWALSAVFPREATWIYVAATLLALVPFGRRAIALARAGSPFSIETLMCAAALGAVVIGAAAEAAVVVLLFAVGELLENVAAGQARAGIRALASLIPRTARREAGGIIEEVPAASLAVGDVVQVRPGDRLPCDGEIVEGQSALDESPVTGESMPVPRGPGEPVVAGSINADGVLRVRVTREAADNTVARIITMVEEASASRAPTQRFVERFARWWTPGAMAAALLVIVVPPLVFGGEWWTWTYRGLALLLIACPCALVISVPAAVASGLSAGARRGLLVKGGAALEAIGAAKMVAFDKTGTLTEGKPRVTDVVPLADGVDENRVLALAAAVEDGSSHPLARAILSAAAERGLPMLQGSEAQAVPGKAVQATVEGRPVAVGSPRHATEAGAGLDTDARARAEALEAEGKTCVVVLAGCRAGGPDRHARRTARGRSRRDRRVAPAGRDERHADRRQRADGPGHRRRVGHGGPRRPAAAGQAARDRGVAGRRAGGDGRRRHQRRPGAGGGLGGGCHGRRHRRRARDGGRRHHCASK